MNSSKSNRRIRGIGIIALSALGVVGNVQAAVNLAQAPLYTLSSVKPNLMFVVDNSGSMDSEVLMPTNDGALWWHTGDRSFVGRDANDAAAPGTVNFNRAGGANGTWKKYTYLFPNGSGVPERVYSDSDHDHFAIPPTAPFAWVRSPDYNGMYYDPSVEYAPWVDFSGQDFEDIDPTAAPSDARLGGQQLDLTANITSRDNNWVFQMWPGMVIPEGTYFRDTDDNWKTATSDIVLGTDRRVPIRYYPATYYVRSTTGGYVTDNFTGTCDAPNPAHYLDFASAPDDFISADADALGPDGSCLVRHEIKSGNSFPSGRSYDEEMQNFANWFSYYRKRHLALRGGAAAALDPLEGFRIGGFPINQRTLQGMWDFDIQRDNFFSWLYARGGNNGGTPNRLALREAGEQYRTNSNIITHSCQHNFTLLFTDGYSNPDPVSVGNADGSAGSPFADTFSGTIADIAMNYYLNPLRTDINMGNVPVRDACPVEPSDPAAPGWVDCNADLHMVTYGITLGARGHIFGVTHEDVIDAHDNPPVWQNPTTARNPVQVDDLFHAAVNTRGQMLNAQNSTELATALQSALRAILDVPNGSSSSVAANSTRLDLNTLVYQARFDDDDWSGELLAYTVDADGNLAATPSWDAGQRIPLPGARNIVTLNDVTGTGALFLWDELSLNQQAALDLDSVGVDDDRGAARLAWLRGDKSNEAPNGLRFRARPNSVLGDIVNSDPVFVGDQNYGNNILPGTEGSSYVSFRNAAAYKTRKKMLYVGANDGMLHGFDAATGDEVLAYVPKAVYADLSKLTAPDYQHRFFVNGSPRSADAYIDSTGSGTKSWRTVLVGTAGAGARSVFALDVTDPDGFGASDVLWERTGADLPGLGYTLGEVAIGRVKAGGKWVAIIGNGYNSDSHTARLYVIDLADGSVLGDFDTGVGSAADPNGLHAPVPVDVNGDRIVDFVYAGDLKGNIWKFDLTSVDGSLAGKSEWNIVPHGGAVAPLFTAADASGVAQPVAVRPTIGAHPRGGLMIYFGTGKFFETGDEIIAATPQIQTFYGIWDTGTAVTRANLQAQTIDWEGEVSFATPDGGSVAHDLRVVSENQVDYATKKGWQLDLISPNLGGVGVGERVISRALLRDGRIIFTSMIPSPDPCEPGGDGWLMELDAVSGARITEAVFDLNGDGYFDEDDWIEIDDGAGGKIKVPPSGIKSTEGIINTPGVIEDGDKEFKFASGSQGGIQRIVESSGDVTGRKGWWQLR
jgi:type IV pilus assembly protein PilY1